MIHEHARLRPGNIVFESDLAQCELDRHVIQCDDMEKQHPEFRILVSETDFARHLHRVTFPILLFRDIAHLRLSRGRPEDIGTTVGDIDLLIPILRLEDDSPLLLLSKRSLHSSECDFRFPGISIVSASEEVDRLREEHSFSEHEIYALLRA